MNSMHALIAQARLENKWLSLRSGIQPLVISLLRLEGQLKAGYLQFGAGHWRLIDPWLREKELERAIKDAAKKLSDHRVERFLDSQAKLELDRV